MYLSIHIIHMCMHCMHIHACLCVCMCRDATRSFGTCSKNMPEGGLLLFKLSPYKTSESPSQPGGGPPPLPLGFAGL